MDVERTGSPLGVCVLPQPPDNCARTCSYPDYIHEILGHAGVCCSSVAPKDLPESLAELRILLTVGGTPLPDDTLDALGRWVSGGGAWISIAGTCGADDLFGVKGETAVHSSWGGGIGTLGEGYLFSTAASHPMMQRLDMPLHYFNGVPVSADDKNVLARVLDMHQRPTSRAAVVESSPGSGRCLLIGPDVTGTVVHIQQGRAVSRDGINAPDGTAPICDNVLKSGDGGVLDWIFDRQDVQGVPDLRAFLQPIADKWRELVLCSIFYLAREMHLALPVLWLYPRDLPAVAHMSHDTDGNSADNARKMLKVINEAGLRNTWCVLLPGYPAELLRQIRSDGHELAMHFDAMAEDRPWSKAEFDSQHRELVKLFGGETPVSNKNHYLRWEGDTEFFNWCVEKGIRLDQSKGASKTGEAGFNFGTCHPYFPVGPDGELIDVLELATPTQDLIVFAPEQVASSLTDAVVRHHGVLHLLFHPAHIEKPDVEKALLAAVRSARNAGMEWWTARRINDWERARRAASWRDFSLTANGAEVTLRSEDALPGASIMWLGAEAGYVEVDGAAGEARTVERWGFKFQSVTFDIEPCSEHRLRTGF